MYRRFGWNENTLFLVTSDHGTELWDHGLPLDAERNETLALLAVSAGVTVVATNTLVSPATNRSIAAAFSAIGICPCTNPCTLFHNDNLQSARIFLIFKEVIYF